MRNTANQELPFAVHSTVRLIANGEPAPVVFDAEVIELEPLRLGASDGSAERLAPGSRVLLVHQTATQLWRIEAEVTAARAREARWQCELRTTKVWEIDRRLSPRFPVNVPAQLGLVFESEGEAHYHILTATVVNISATGARVLAQNNVPAGAVLHVTIDFGDGRRAKALAITAFKQAEGPHIGLSFIEFLEDGQYHLHDFIGRQAA